MKLQITFPDGTQDAIFLSDSEVRKLEYQVKKQHLQSKYTLADELYFAIHMYALDLKEIPDKERNEADEGKRDPVRACERE